MQLRAWMVELEILVILHVAEVLLDFCKASSSPQCCWAMIKYNRDNGWILDALLESFGVIC